MRELLNVLAAAGRYVLGLLVALAEWARLHPRQWKEVLSVVRRWRLWRGDRRRAKITRHWLGTVRLDFDYDKRRGFRLVAWALLEVRGQVRAAFREWRIDVPKKPAAAAAGGEPNRQAAPRPKMLERTPTLASFLLDLQYEDGAGPREPSYLILRAAGGEWMATLKDPTEARQLRLRVSDLGTVYAALEALLAADSCPWEPDTWAQGKAGGRRRK